MIRILHLSDFHFCQRRQWDAVPLLAELRPAIERILAENGPPDLLALTGDFARAGKREEFALAEDWIEEQLLPMAGIDRQHCFMVPGNHDVDRARIPRMVAAYQETLVSEASQEAVADLFANPEERRPFLARLEAYSAFVARLRGEPETPEPWWSTTLKHADGSIHLAGLCSSWLSSSDRDKSQLILGRYQLNQALQAAGQADFSIALVHHPLDYLPDFDLEEADRQIRQKCQLLLRGHLHKPQTRVHFGGTKQYAAVAAGSSYAGGSYPNSFNWIEIDLGQALLKVQFWIWLDGEWMVDRNHANLDSRGFETLELQRRRPTAAPESEPEPGAAVRDVVVVPDFPGPPENVVFVYGSLLDPDSLSRTIARKDRATYCVPAVLKNYRRSWGASLPRVNMVGPDWRSVGPYLWDSATIEPGAPSDSVDGALIDVSAEDLEQLVLREGSYTLKEVSARVVLAPSGRPSTWTVKTFVPKSPCSDEPELPRVVRREYFEIIARALERLGFTRRLEPPQHGRILEAHDADIKLERVWRQSDRIAEFHANLHKRLAEARVTRKVGGGEAVIPSCVRPLVFSHALYTQIARTAEAAVSLATKALKLATLDERLVRRAGFRDLDVEMAREGSSQASLLPQIARVDFTLYRDRLALFELNTDSPGGMFHLDELARWQSYFCAELGLRPSLATSGQGEARRETIQALRAAWRQFKAAHGLDRELRRVAIVDCEPADWATFSEFEYFRDQLRQEGLKAHICEPQDLRLDERTGCLTYQDQPVDLVYKRILWKDLRNYPEEEAAFARSFAVGGTCIANSLYARMLGSKYLLAIMSRADFRGRLASRQIELTSEEAAILDTTLPRTFVWGGDEALKREVLAEPSRWVLKSYTGYGSYEVEIGAEIERPKSEFAAKWSSDYVVQEYVNHGRVPIPVVRRGRVRWEYNYFILGAYIMDGRFAAMEAKLGQHLPITMNVMGGVPHGYRTAVFPAAADSA